MPKAEPKAEIVGDAIHAEVEIAAPPEKVFRALTDPEQLRLWWGSQAQYKTADWEMDLRPGGRWRCFARNQNTGVESEVAGEVLEIDPPRTFAFTWNPSWAKMPATVVRYNLVPIPSGTRVSVVHTGFGDHKKEQQEHTHWAQVLAWLEAYLSAAEV